MRLEFDNHCDYNLIDRLKIDVARDDINRTSLALNCFIGPKMR